MTIGVRRKRHGHAWLALAGYLLLTLGLTYPLVTQFGRAIPGDGFDGWQNYWNLWWIKTAVARTAHPPLVHPSALLLPPASACSFTR